MVLDANCIAQLSLDSTLQEALAGERIDRGIDNFITLPTGQTVIEYPTLFFGWSQHMSQLRSLVTEADALNPLLLDSAAKRSRTGTKLRSKKSLSRQRASAPPAAQVDIDSANVCNSPAAGSRGVTELLGVLPLGDYGSDEEVGTPGEVEEGEVPEDDEAVAEQGQSAAVEHTLEEDDEEEEAFFTALAELEGADIASLQAIISVEEASLAATAAT